MAYQQEMLNPSWTDEPLDTTVKIKKVHIDEIRQYLEELTSATGCLQDYSTYHGDYDAPHDASLNGGFHDGFRTGHLHSDYGTHYHTKHDTVHTNENHPVDTTDHGTYHDHVESTHYGNFKNMFYTDEKYSEYGSYVACFADCPNVNKTQNSTINSTIFGKDFATDKGSHYTNENTDYFSSWDFSRDVSDNHGEHTPLCAGNLTSRQDGVQPNPVYECLYEGSVSSGNFHDILVGLKMACQTHDSGQMPYVTDTTTCNGKFCSNVSGEHGTHFVQV